MTSTTPKTFFITGVSSGFGRSLAVEALAAGHRVVGTVRNAAAATTFTGLHEGRVGNLLPSQAMCARKDAL